MAEYIERDFIIKNSMLHTWKKADLLKAIKEAPAADVVEVRHGEWVETTVLVEHPNGYYKEKRYVCPYCCRTEEEKEPYCNCGAKMGGKDGEGE